MHQPVPAERYFSGPALPVAQACQHDDAEGVVQALARSHVSPNFVGEQGMSLLLLAISNRSLGAVRALLTHGADPNLRTELGRRQEPCQAVALVAGGDMPEMLRLLLDHGGDPNAEFRGPALLNAAEGERFEQLHLLVEYGANINAVNEESAPLLVRLARFRHFEQVAYLIERGANALVPDLGGNTVASELQEQGFKYEPSDYIYPWVVKVKHLLEARGVHFPVPDPSITLRARFRAENAQRREWEKTPEGRQLTSPLKAAERATELGQVDQDYNGTMHRRMAAEVAFQAWRKKQPHYDRLPLLPGEIPLYPSSLDTPAEEMANEPRKVDMQADSARWAEQARAIH